MKIKTDLKDNPFGPPLRKGSSSGREIQSFELRLDPDVSLENNLEKIVAEMSEGFDRGAEMAVIREQFRVRQASMLSTLVQDENLDPEVRAKYQDMLTRINQAAR
jgi:hypothetical protein